MQINRREILLNVSELGPKIKADFLPTGFDNVVGFAFLIDGHFNLIH